MPSFTCRVGVIFGLKVDPKARRARHPSRARDKELLAPFFCPPTWESQNWHLFWMLDSFFLSLLPRSLYCPMFSWNRPFLFFPPAGFSLYLRMLIALFVIFSAAQLSQSAYFALQCPYTVFGLGRTPNFVDELAVGIPRSKGSVRLTDHCLCPKSFKNT